MKIRVCLIDAAAAEKNIKIKQYTQKKRILLAHPISNPFFCHSASSSNTHTSQKKSEPCRLNPDFIPFSLNLVITWKVLSNG